MSGFFVLSSFYTTAYPSDFRAVFSPNSQEEFWEWVEKGDFKILLSIYPFVDGHDFETSEYSARQESHLGITRSLWKKSFMKMWNCTARIKFFWMLIKLLDLGTRCMNLKCLHFLLLTTLFFLQLLHTSILLVASLLCIPEAPASSASLYNKAGMLFSQRTILTLVKRSHVPCFGILSVLSLKHWLKTGDVVVH